MAQRGFLKLGTLALGGFSWSQVSPWRLQAADKLSARIRRHFHLAAGRAAAHGNV